MNNKFIFAKISGSRYESICLFLWHLPFGLARRVAAQLVEEVAALNAGRGWACAIGSLIGGCLGILFRLLFIEQGLRACASHS